MNESPLVQHDTVLLEIALNALKSIRANKRVFEGYFTAFGVNGCICPWIKPLKLLQAMTQNLEPLWSDLS